MSDASFLQLRRGWDAFMDGQPSDALPGKPGSAERMFGEMGWRLAVIRAHRDDSQYGRDTVLFPGETRGLDVSKHK